MGVLNRGTATLRRPGVHVGGGRSRARYRASERALLFGHGGVVRDETVGVREAWDAVWRLRVAGDGADARTRLRGRTCSRRVLVPKTSGTHVKGRPERS